MRDTLVIGNWKLNGNKNTITNSLINLTNRFINISKCRIIIAPPLVYLDAARFCLLSSSNQKNNQRQIIYLCAQNVDIHASGSFTGDISATMLQDLTVKYALIGHSERRIYHKEDDLYIIKKFSILKKSGLIPILCIGEDKKEHDSKSAQIICINQIDLVIKSLGIQALKNSIIAYEPIWAIGKKTSSSPDRAQLIHKTIRNHIAQYDSCIANQILIQYGGSINSDNVIQFISQQDIDGVLIGSAALDVNSFSTIVHLIETYKHKQNTQV